MSETSNENSHNRERHRRGRGRGGKGSGQAPREASGRRGTDRRDASRSDSGRSDNGRREESRRDERLSRGRQERPEARDQYDLPPLPKLPTPLCPKCGQPITDITSALPDKNSGEALHFDCVLSFLQGAETLGANEKIVYIGQGRFAVMHFDNPSDTRKFRILRVIEWEGRDVRPEWRSDVAGLFSQVH